MDIVTYALLKKNKLTQVNSYNELPEKGVEGALYITKDTGQTYYWDNNSQMYVATGTSGRTGVYLYNGELPTAIGSTVDINKTDLEVIVEPTVAYSEGSEISAINAVHGLIVSSTDNTVTVKTVTDMTIDSFRQVDHENDLPSTGISNILYAIKDIKEFRVWDSTTNTYVPYPTKPTGIDNAQIHVSVSADNVIAAELQTGSIDKTYLTQVLQNDLNSLTILPTYNSTTHEITFTTLGGNIYSINLPIEDAVDSVTYDSTTSIITVHKLDGTSSTIDLSSLANYTAGNGIEIEDTTIKIKLDSSSSNGLVVTSNGLGINTVTEHAAGSMSAADKVKLNSLENYDDTEIKSSLANKVDKVSGKGLSTNDFTTEEKTKLSGLENYDDTSIRNLLNLKVDKVNGKQLSTEDYTTAEKTKLAGLENYDDTEIKADLANKVDKVSGKQLSTEDYTTAEKTKLEGLDPNGEENVIEIVKVDGVALTPDANKAVNVTLPVYTLLENETRPGYAKTYNLKKDGVIVGDTIEIPENSIIKGGTVGTVTVPDEPYEGAQVGDKYIDLELESQTESHVYVPLKDLIVGYIPGNGVDISGANEISIKIDSNNANGLATSSNGLSLANATLAVSGAMTPQEKYKLQNLSNYDDTQILSDLDTKVDKVSGKGLSTNDYSTDEKTKLSGIERNAQENDIETIKVNNQIIGAVDKVVSLTIPNKTSQLTNDLGFVADANYVHTDNNYTDSEKNKLASLSNYDDADLRNAIDSKQDELVSGVNIKTVNNESLIGSGNVEIITNDRLSSTLTANQTVGGVEAGTTFAVGTTLETIIRQILNKGSEPTPVTSYTVSFNTYGGSSVPSQVVEAGGKATRPSENPTKSGYTFDNWYTTSSFDTLFNFNNTINNDTVVHAKFNLIPVPEYTVTFNSEGGSSVASQTVQEGSKATRPTNPTKSGYTFDDWYTDDTFTTKYNFNTAITANITLYANWNPIIVTHTVTFYDGGTVLSTQTVEDNTRATRPADPTKSGYTFDNWYSDSQLTTAFNFNTYIVADTNVYAKFIENPTPENYDVYIGGFDNASCSTATIFANKTTAQLQANVIESHQVSETQPFHTVLTFGDSTKNSIYYIMVKNGIVPTRALLTSAGTESPFDESEITDSTVWRATHTDVQINSVNYKVYGYRAKFNNDDTFDLWIDSSTPVTTYTVTFNTDGGSSVPSQTVEAGHTATKPNDPTKQGYTFDNWYSDSQLTTVFDFSTTINANTTIYAKWNEIPVTTYTVSFDTHGGSSVSSQTINAGEYATRPNDPTRSGYTFDDWYSDTTYTTKFNFATTAINANTTVHANWTEIPVVTHTVSFNTHGGSSVASQTVNDGEHATRPATDPTKSGNTFGGWYTTDQYTTEFDFANTVINADTIIHAKWTEIPVVTHTVTFYDEATVLSTETVNDGSTATKPADPTKSGYAFDDWYTDTTYTTKFNFSTAITADTPVYAKFTPDTPTSTYDLYICKMDNTTLTNFANKSTADLEAGIVEQYNLSDTQPHVTTLNFADNTKNNIYYVMIKDGRNPSSAELISAGQSSPFTESEIKDDTVWRATHDDITISGTTYKIYGYRARFNDDDTMSFSIK